MLLYRWLNRHYSFLAKYLSPQIHSLHHLGQFLPQAHNPHRKGWGRSANCELWIVKGRGRSANCELCAISDISTFGCFFFARFFLPFSCRRSLLFLQRIQLSPIWVFQKLVQYFRADSFIEHVKLKLLDIYFALYISHWVTIKLCESVNKVKVWKSESVEKWKWFTWLCPFPTVWQSYSVSQTPSWGRECGCQSPSNGVGVSSAPWPSNQSTTNSMTSLGDKILPFGNKNILWEISPKVCYKCVPQYFELLHLLLGRRCWALGRAGINLRSTSLIQPF